MLVAQSGHRHHQLLAILESQAPECAVCGHALSWQIVPIETQAIPGVTGSPAVEWYSAAVCESCGTRYRAPAPEV